MSDDVPECTDCGACCYPDYESPDYVHLTEAERRLLVMAGHGEKATEGDYPSMKTCYDRFNNCKCIALEGTLGDGAPVRCTIYDIRPSVCRNFKPGSAVCYEARRAAGMVGSDR